jgi:hypothetical protein
LRLASFIFYLCSLNFNAGALSLLANITYNPSLIRYMEDIIIFCKNRYTLRGIIKVFYGVLDKLKLKLAYII